MSDLLPNGADPEHRILVTGGSGFIGRHVVADLRGSGLPVRIVDLVPHPDPSVDAVIGDIADQEVVAAAFDGGVAGVVHLAAVTSVLRSVEQPGKTYRTNVAGTANLLEAARRGGVGSFVFASTNAVVGPMTGPVIDEGSALNPLTPYGATKAAAEMLMSAYTAAYGVRGAALRFTNVYGLGMAAKDSIVARLMRTILNGTTLEIYGDGTQVRDYVNVSDVVAAIRMALIDARWAGATVIGCGSSISVVDLVEAVRRTTGAPLRTRHVAPKAGEMPAVIVDNRKARRAGWAPSTGLEEGLAQVWRERSEAGGAPVAPPAAGAPVAPPAPPAAGAPVAPPAAGTPTPQRNAPE